MPRDWRLRIVDILDAIARIQAYVAGIDEHTFRSDPRTIHAVAYNLLVLGDAAARLPGEVAERYPDLPWSKMRAMRNVMAHEYFDVEPGLLWKTVTSNLPPLIAPLEELLAGEDSD